ncbi:MAG: YlxM family DNA-binding protein [Bacillota bacterium]|jgi:predicted DNA-binding protein YlxM (UPF0122 family)
MDKRAHIAILFDFYRLLLTKKQRETLRLFYEQDLSLSEIGELMAISRQAVYDLLKRGETLLEKYEKQLLMAETYCRQQRQIKELGEVAQKLQSAPSEVLWQNFWYKWQMMKDGD